MGLTVRVRPSRRSGGVDIAHKEQLLAAAVGAHCAVPTRDIYADGSTAEILCYSERCPASAERVQNHVTDVAIEFDESAWELWWELARVIKVAPRVCR